MPFGPTDVDSENEKLLATLHEKIDRAKTSGDLNEVMQLAEEIEKINNVAEIHYFEVFGREVNVTTPVPTRREDARNQLREFFESEETGRYTFETLRREAAGKSG